MLGRPILVGDTVAYPNRRGSVTEMCLAEIELVGVGSWLYARKETTNRLVKLTHLERVVVCRRADTPRD
jgi:hypothetical protein